MVDGGFLAMLECTVASQRQASRTFTGGRIRDALLKLTTHELVHDCAVHLQLLEAVLRLDLGVGRLPCRKLARLLSGHVNDGCVEQHVEEEVHDRDGRGGAGLEEFIPHS